eukprot:TRINITY_DN10957_c0_g2_i8.p1 TRINITY_DN10957_c0_g2~~TRINITY_DN10957_c0_g2_i8.p1  ORF type:complete len:536 (+),score=78.83 TRINITY_DN10957_c0_g2_i8:63-1610(+)
MVKLQMRSEGGEPHSCMHLTERVVWCCCGLDASQVSPAALRQVSHDVAGIVAEMEGRSHLSSYSQIEAALQHNTSPDVAVLVPESMVEMDYCQWNGDGLYEMSLCVQSTPPSIKQILTLLRLLRGQTSELTICLFSAQKRAVAAVLAGAVLVLSQGFSAEKAWERILQAGPQPSADPAVAWDRFAPSFSRTGETTSTSLTVFDCLAALEFARKKSWVPDLDNFDDQAWQLLREKLDASWIIPGEMLAMAHPWDNSFNPRFPGMLELSVQSPKPIALTSSLAEQQSGSDGRIPHASLSSLSQKNITPSTANNSTGSLEWMAAAGAVKRNSEHISPWAGDAVSQETEQMLKDTYATYFRRFGVRTVVRLNYQYESPCQMGYELVFLKEAVRVTELPFTDGDIPPKSLVKTFLRICCKAHMPGSQPLAVHCMGGLGRTGVLMGTYAVSHHRMTGSAFHGWVRMCRPGSVQTTCQERFLRGLKPEVSLRAKIPSFDSIFESLKTVLPSPSCIKATADDD